MKFFYNIYIFLIHIILVFYSDPKNDMDAIIKNLTLT